MLRVLALMAQVLVLALVAYNLAIALAGWRNPTPPGRGRRSRRLRAVIPAHNEDAVLGGLLSDLERQRYGNLETWVLADRCTDETVAVAAGRARVDERSAGDPGKGALLAWHLQRHPLQADEAIVVLDADNRVPPGLIARLADELDAGRSVVQAYLDTVEPDGSWLVTASALSYWASNRMVQLARSNLGLSCDLGGTGMCFTSEALAAVGGLGDHLTEDQDLWARLIIAGVPVAWLHDVRVHDEKPSRLGIAVRQRARWMAGKRSVRRRYLLPLLRRHTLASVDAAVRLLQPGRTLLAFITAVLAVAAALTGSDWLLPWWLWAAAAILQLLAPIPFLARDGVPARYLVRYPLMAVFGLLWLPVRVASSFSKRWYHTPHGR